MVFFIFFFSYCFRRKQHSYAACDAAPAASLYINTYELKFKKMSHSQDEIFRSDMNEKIYYLRKNINNILFWFVE